MENLSIEEIKKQVIIGLASNDKLLETLVLKGGNAIYYGHKIEARGSKDIDYSMEQDFERDLDTISREMEDALNATFNLIDYTIFDFSLKEKPKCLDKDLQDFWGGYEAKFKVIRTDTYKNSSDLSEARRQSTKIHTNQSTVFTVDISKHEYCGKKSLTTIDDYNLYVYPLELIVAEKLRALCQQLPAYKEIIKSNTITPRPRDFYDIYIITAYYAPDFDVTDSEFRDLLTKVFRTKKVPVHWLLNISGQFNFHNQEAPALEATIKGEKQNFRFYFNYVVQHIIKPLEPYLNI